MNMLRHAVVPALALLAAAPAFAAPAKPPAKATEKITCREFIALDDEFKPQAVSYVLGYDKAKRPEVEGVDVTGVASVVPVLVDTCKARPEETLLQRIRAELHRL